MNRYVRKGHEIGLRLNVNTYTNAARMSRLNVGALFDRPALYDEGHKMRMKEDNVGRLML